MMSRPVESATIATMTRSGHLIDLSSVPADLRTAGQRWRWSRNVTIALAYNAGMSQRFLAEVFDLPRSRIAEIIRAQRARAWSGLSDRAR
jgi:hypothetical protein